MIVCYNTWRICNVVSTETIESSLTWACRLWQTLSTAIHPRQTCITIRWAFTHRSIPECWIWAKYWIFCLRWAVTTFRAWSSQTEACLWGRGAHIATWNTKYMYCKFSIISSNFLFLISNKMLVIMAGYHKKSLSERQTGKSPIRLLLGKQSDLGLPYLSIFL